MSTPQPPQPPELSSPWHTPVRAALQQRAREFTRDVVLPVAAKLDPIKGEFPDDFVAQIAAEGYFGITIDTDHGGMGQGVFEYCMISEELARGWMSVASVIARGQGFGTNVADAARRDELLRRSAAGTWIGGASFSEPGAGSDLAGVSTLARREGDTYILNGRKRWTGYALKADFLQILVREREPLPGEPRAAGLLNLLVDKEPGAFPAGIRGQQIDKIGYHGFTTWELELTDVAVPVANLIGENEGTDSFRNVQRHLNIARVHTAARAVGLARAAVEDCTDYLQRREQFGRPLSDFQALRFDLADMAAQVSQARSFYQHVAHRIDLGEPCETEAAMCKLMATEMAVRVTNTAMQLFGGNGYTTEHAVERYWRDARLTTIFEGTSQIQRRIISDRMLTRSSLS